MRLFFLGAILWVVPLEGAGATLALLKSVNTTQEVQAAKKALRQHRRLELLCRSSQTPQSLNRHCYRLAQQEGRSGGVLMAAWRRECVQAAEVMSWEEISPLEVSGLPSECRSALESRREELIYRHSEDSSFFWKLRVSVPSLTPPSHPP